MSYFLGMNVNDKINTVFVIKKQLSEELQKFRFQVETESFVFNYQNKISIRIIFL